MIPISLRGVAEAAEGVVEPPAAADIMVSGAVADSRLAGPGDLYVAIIGERADGHDFAAAAGQAGAVAVLGSRPTDLPTVVVDDPVAGLGRVAHAHLAALPDTDVVAVTGSSGKTSTKDLIAEVVAERGSAVAPQGSFNTDVGLPLTVLQAGPQTRTLVLEMGARGRGHIARLCRIAAPDVAAVLNVGSAHLGEFGSRAAIATAKQEIIEGLQSDGTAVLYADDPVVAGMAEVAPGRVLTFGESASADVRIADLRLDEKARAVFTLAYDGESAPVQLLLHGEHHARNAAAAAAIGVALGIPLDAVARRLSTAKSRSKWRMEVTTTEGGITVVNDAYNANPESMRAALKALATMGRAAGGRTWAVLGEMKELGEDTIAEHDAIGRQAVRLDISFTMAVGQAARPLYLGAAQEGSWDGEALFAADVPEAIETLRSRVQPGDIVLVKASRGVALERIAQALGAAS